MLITLYKSSLCPRCYMARKYLQELVADREDIEIQTVDILSSPSTAIRDGIRMIPAIRIGKRILSGLYLNKRTIAAFLGEQ